jgi:glutathione S-transferase
MLKFYYNSISSNARRVWVALLEKNIPFEAILMNLDGDQFQSEYLEINPFHHIPTIDDDGFIVFESLAILDYLEAIKPTPTLLPTEAKALALVRTINLITLNELQPSLIPSLRQMVGASVDPQALEKSKQQVHTVLQFFENKLDSNRVYFIDGNLTQADIVAGTVISSLPFLGFSLETYPKLRQWFQHLEQRESFKQTNPSPAEIEAAKAKIKAVIERKS